MKRKYAMEEEMMDVGAMGAGSGMGAMGAGLGSMGSMGAGSRKGAMGAGAMGAGAMRGGMSGMMPEEMEEIRMRETMTPRGMKKGGAVKKYKSGGYVKSADGCVKKGKTKGRFV